MQEEGAIRKELKTLLTPLCTDGSIGNVVDTYSFVIRVLLKAIFEFFVSQVRKIPPAFTQGPRIKDREDMVKTYYVCGCVLHSVKNILRRRKDAEVWLRCFEHFTVDITTAAKDALPTRHVTLKTGGGLLFVSKACYEVMSKMENYFFCTV